MEQNPGDESYIYGGGFRPLMSSRHEEETLAEPLILASVGTKGYLKFPAAFIDRYEFVSTSLPNPTAKMVARNGTIRLIYEWSDEQMEQAKKDAPAARKIIRDRANKNKEE